MNALTDCVSSVLSGFGYDSDARTLDLRFNSGNIRRYVDVPDDVYEALLRTVDDVAEGIEGASIGRFYSLAIKGRYLSKPIVEN